MWELSDVSSRRQSTIEMNLEGFNPTRNVAPRPSSP
jgi:hypothetical protein